MGRSAQPHCDGIDSFPPSEPIIGMNGQKNLERVGIDLQKCVSRQKNSIRGGFRAGAITVRSSKKADGRLVLGAAKCGNSPVSKLIDIVQIISRAVTAACKVLGFSLCASPQSEPRGSVFL